VRNVQSQNIFGVQKLIPAVVFYVSLRRQAKLAKNRNEAMAEIEAGTAGAYRHSGRFNQELVAYFDSGSSGEQFDYRQNADGSFHKGCTDPLPPKGFERLLASTEKRMKEFGNAIFHGETRLNPYHYHSETPCGICEYQSICRIDPWTHKFRALEGPHA